MCFSYNQKDHLNYLINKRGPQIGLVTKKNFNVSACIMYITHTHTLTMGKLLMWQIPTCLDSWKDNSTICML